MVGIYCKVVILLLIMIPFPVLSQGGFATTGTPTSSATGGMGYKCDNSNVCASGYVCTSEVGRNVGDVTNPKFNNWTPASIHAMLERNKNYTEPCYSSGAENCHRSETHLSVIRDAANEVQDESNETGLALMNQDCLGNPECIEFQDIFTYDLTQEIKEFSGNKDHGEACTHPEDCKSLSCGTDGKCEEIKVCTCALEGERPQSGQRCCQDFDFDSEADPNLLTYAVGNDGTCQMVEIPKVPYVDYIITLAEGNSCRMIEKHGEGLKFEGETQSMPEDFALKDLIARDYLILAALEFLTSNDEQTDDCLFPKRGDFKDMKFNEILNEKIHKPLKQSREQGVSKYNELIAIIAAQTEESVEKISAVDGFKTVVEGQNALLEFEKAFYNGGFETLLAGKVLEGKSIAHDIGHDYEHVRFDNRWSKKHLNQSRDVDKYDCRGKNTIYGRRSFRRRIEVKGGGGYHTNSYFIDPLFFTTEKFRSIGKKESARSSDEGIKVRSEEDIKAKLRTEFDSYVADLGGTIKIPGFTTGEAQLSTALNDQVFYYVWELFSDYSKKKDGSATWNLRSRHPVKNRVNSFYPKINATIVEVGYYLTQIIQAREAFISCLNNPDGDLNPEGGDGLGATPPPGSGDPEVGQVDQSGAIAGSGSGTGITGIGFGGGTNVGLNIGAGTSNSARDSNSSLSNSGNAGGGLSSTQGRLGATANKIKKAVAKDLLTTKKAVSANPSQAALVAAAGSISGTSALNAARDLFSSKSLLGGFKGLDSNVNGNTATISSASSTIGDSAGVASGDGRTAYKTMIDDDESDGRTAYQASPNTEDQNNLLADVQKEAEKFKPKENDSLWTKVTKAYARIGIPRLFSGSAIKDKNSAP